MIRDGSICACAAEQDTRPICLVEGSIYAGLGEKKRGEPLGGAFQPHAAPSWVASGAGGYLRPLPKRLCFSALISCQMNPEKAREETTAGLSQWHVLPIISSPHYTSPSGAPIIQVLSGCAYPPFRAGRGHLCPWLDSSPLCAIAVESQTLTRWRRDCYWRIICCGKEARGHRVLSESLHTQEVTRSSPVPPSVTAGQFRSGVSPSIIWASLTLGRYLVERGIIPVDNLLRFRHALGSHSEFLFPGLPFGDRFEPFESLLCPLGRDGQLGAAEQETEVNAVCSTAGV